MFSEVLVTTQPLSEYVNRVSLVESAQTRVRLRANGLELPRSRCRADRKSVALMNLALVSGEAGRAVIQDYQHMLQEPEDHPCWHADLGVSKERSISVVFLGVCDGVDLCSRFRSSVISCYGSSRWRVSRQWTLSAHYGNSTSTARTAVMSCLPRCLLQMLARPCF